MDNAKLLKTIIIKKIDEILEEIEYDWDSTKFHDTLIELKDFINEDKANFETIQTNQTRCSDSIVVRNEDDELD